MKKDWKQQLVELHNQNNPQVPDHIWENVKPFLPKKSHQDRFLFLILSGIFLIGVAANNLYQHYNSNTNLSKFSSLSIVENCNNYANTTSNNSMDRIQNATDVKSSNHQRISDKITESLITRSLKSSSSNTKSYHNTSSKKLDFSSNEISNESNITISNEHSADKAVELNLINDQNNYNFFCLPIRSCSGLNTNYKMKHLSISKGECYSFSNKNKAQFFIEAYAGPLFAPYKLSTSNQESIIQLNRRNRTERSQLGFLSGARIGVQLNAWSFKLGAEYQNIYELMSYKNLTDFKIITVRDSGGNQISMDTIWGEKIIKFNNFHRLINIPISIGHTFRLGNNNITPIIGLAMNIYSFHKGALLDSLNEAQIFTTGVNPNFEIYKTQLNLSASLSVQYSILFSNYTSLFFEPGIEYYFKHFNKNSYPINQKYISSHLKIGMRYNF